MKYVNELEVGKKVILEKYPQFINSSFEANNSGWTNFAIKVDGKYIFRFPKHEDAYYAISKEYKVLKILNERLPKNIKVPNYIYSSLNTDYPFVGYELIDGIFLTKDVYAGLDNDKKTILSNDMAEFLNVLHSIDYKILGLDIEDPIKKYQDFFSLIQANCFKYFDKDLIDVTIKFFDYYFNDKTMFDYTPTLIHGDLSEDHIIITEEGVGIIDFGDLMVFDPAYDLIWAYICDECFYKELIDKYKGNKDRYFEHRIRDFHIKRPPYDGIIYANQIHDEEMLKKELNKLRESFLTEISNNKYL